MTAKIFQLTRQSVLSVLLMVAGLASVSQTRAQVATAVPDKSDTYANPIINQDAPDPSVMKADDGFFYLYSTGNKIFRSSNLVDWSYVGSVFDDLHKPTFVPGVTRIWAPDINKIGDQYVLYFALSKWGGIDSCGVGVATSARPTGPFRPVNGTGKLLVSHEIGVRNSFDPFYIEDAGHKYCVWGSFYGIYIIELSDDGLSIKSGAQKQQLVGTAYEGSYIYKRGKYYYYFGSTGTCCEGANSTYRVVYGRSTSLFGPYVNKSGGLLMNNQYETLVQGNSAWAGTGHNAELIEDANGNTWLPYHAYSKTSPSVGRMVLLDLVQWTADGWPYIEGGAPSRLSKKPKF